jgi:branched-chain amino acid transport system ATP-binding protein
VNEGEMCGLIGRNGAGKTTLIRALMGALPASGHAELSHVDLLTLPAYRRVSHGIGYMPEDRRLVPEFTVEENIRLPTWSTKIDGADQRLEWIYTIMPELAGFASRRALIAGTHILLLDEPFEGLAPALARRLGEVLANLKNEGVSVLIAESNEVHVLDLLARAYFIERGAVSDEKH